MTKPGNSGPFDRRTFLAASGIALAGVGPFLHLRRGRHDLVLRGGTVFDGLGNPGTEADVAINGDRIAAIGAQLAERGSEEIDVRGLAVAPGFIDIHSHADGNLQADPRAESVIRQGITTVVVGADGGSRIDLGEYFRSLETLQPAINVASMIGLGSVRGGVVGADDRPATPQELDRMRTLVERALIDGACGASSGLEYTPGAFASEAELIELCRPLKARRLPYATHMRNEDDRVLESIRESLAVAKGAGVPLQISHLKMQGPRNWPRLDDAFRMIESAHAEGVDVAFDRYPYVAYSTGLTNLFPVWSRDGGTDAFLARLADPTTGTRIRQETLAKIELIGGWDNVLITSVREAPDRSAEGQRLGRWAADRGEDPLSAAIGLLERNRGSVGMVGFAMSEENLERILAHPLGMVCSDGGSFAVEGPARRGSPHPRGLGSFPRVLGRYARDRGIFSLEHAIRRMSSLPSDRVGLTRRGRLVPDSPADLVVFDYATVADRASFEAPFQYPEGIPLVIVNGSITLRDGGRTERGTGRAIRPGV
jgi:N-acyl-D-amino-acid deacylase